MDIMRQGGWSDLDMVSRYCRGSTFDDCLGHYTEALLFSSSVKRVY